MRLPLGHLSLGHQPAVIIFVTRDRGAPALDCVSEEAGRMVVIDGGEHVGHCGDAIAAEVFHECGKLDVAAAVDERGNVALVAEIVHQTLAPNGSAHERQCRVELVGAIVDPFPKAFTARFLECGALKDAVFDAHDVPAKGVENILDPLEQPLMHDAVERLAVIVDDPPGVAQTVFPAFLQALVDIAFIKLRIADKGDHPAGAHVLAPAFGGNVVLHDRREGGDRHSEPHRPGGEVHIVSILGAARITLDATVSAEILHLLASLVAHEILNRVKNWGCMRFDGDAVLRTQCRKIERRHDRHQGRR
ncbi:hypothetical protein D3C87_1192880 [compost metagenome]